MPPGPLKKKFDAATFEAAEAFLRKTAAEVLAKAYAAVDQQVETAAEKFEAKKQELRASAQAK